MRVRRDDGGRKEKKEEKGIMHNKKDNTGQHAAIMLVRAKELHFTRYSPQKTQQYQTSVAMNAVIPDYLKAGLEKGGGLNDTLYNNYLLRTFISSYPEVFF